MTDHERGIEVARIIRNMYNTWERCSRDIFHYENHLNLIIKEFEDSDIDNQISKCHYSQIFHRVMTREDYEKKIQKQRDLVKRNTKQKQFLEDQLSKMLKDIK